MYKTNSLRAHLTQALPELKRDPDKMLVSVDDGSVVASATASLSFEYRYKLNIVITDHPGGSDAIMVPLLAWVKVHQIDLLQNEEKRKIGIRFEADINNHETLDISITIELSERVIVKGGEHGRLDIRHPAEPQMTPPFADAFWTLYQGDTMLAEWHTPQAAV